MKVETGITQAALVAFGSPETWGAYEGVLCAFRDMPVPVFPDKSSKQGTLDLAHPIVNAMAEFWFKLAGWERQCSIASVTQGVHDERKTIDFVYSFANGRKIALEVQFGNGGRLQADFAKFRTLHEQGLLELAVAVYFDRATAATADSGLAHYEAALRELPKFEGMPLALVGLSREGCEAVDLRSLKDIVYPAILGGSGRNRLELHADVAEALLEGRPLADFDVRAEHRQVIAEHALEHVDKALAALMADYERANACGNPALRMRLLAKFADFARNTYAPPEERARNVRGAVVALLDEEEARERTRRQELRARREVRAKALRAQKRADERRAKLEHRALVKAAEKAAEKVVRDAARGPARPVVDALDHSCKHSAGADTKASLELMAALPGKAIRVTRAEEHERRAREAAAQACHAKPPPLKFPSWNTMGVRMAEAHARVGAG